MLKSTLLQTNVVCLTIFGLLSENPVGIGGTTPPPKGGGTTIAH